MRSPPARRASLSTSQIRAASPPHLARRTSSQAVARRVESELELSYTRQASLPSSSCSCWLARDYLRFELRQIDIMDTDLSGHELVEKCAEKLLKALLGSPVNDFLGLGQFESLRDQVLF